MNTLFTGEKLNKLFETVPEFNHGNITYDIIDFDNANFGGFSDQLEITSGYDFITSMSLRITLPAITTHNRITNGAGYINYVNNVGHSIIEAIDFRINEQIIVPPDFPYGRWLDIHQELNDSVNNEMDMIGKKESNSEVDSYQNATLNLNVPLHMWFSESIEKALPFFLIQNPRILLKIKLKKLASIINISAGKTIATDVITTGQPTVKLNLGHYQLQDRELRKQLFTQNYSVYFNYYSFTKKTINTVNDNVISIETPESTPLKQMAFAMVHQDRDTEKDTVSLVSINKTRAQVNNNDTLNYGNNGTFIIENTLDTFSLMDFKINNKTFYSDGLRAPFLRTIMPLDNNKKVPRKPIYNLTFTPDKYHDPLYGCVDMEYVDNMNLNFSSPMASSNMYVFFTHLKKMSIVANKLEIDNWFMDDKEARRTGFRLGKSHKNKKEIETVSQKTIDERDSLIKLGNMDSVRSYFLVIDADTDKKTADVVIGDIIDPNIILSIKHNRHMGSVCLSHLSDSINEINDLSILSGYQKKLPEHLLKNIRNTIKFKQETNAELSVESFFEPILPFSRGFFIRIGNQLHRLDYWLYNKSFKKDVAKIDEYLANMEMVNKNMDARIYRFSFGDTYLANKRPFKKIDNMKIEIDSNLINLLKWTNKVADEPHIILIPAEFAEDEILSSDLTKKQLQQIYGTKLPLSEQKDYIFQDIKEMIIINLEQKLPSLIRDAKDNREASNYKNKYARIQAIYDYINRKYNNDKYPNFFLVDGTKNSNMLIRGVPEETALSLDEMNNYLRGRILSKVYIEPRKGTIEFEFLKSNSQ